MNYVLYLTAHRGHFVKFHECDLTRGQSSNSVSELLEHFLVQMKSSGTGPSGTQPANIIFTDEEAAAIAKQMREVNSAAPVPGQVFQPTPEMARALTALGLVENVRAQMNARFGNVPEAEFPRFMDKIIKTQAKAYAIHSFPLYLYLWGWLNYEKGDVETAKGLCSKFLSEQANFKPSKVDEMIIQLITIEGWYGLDEDIKNARTIIAS